MNSLHGGVATRCDRCCRCEASPGLIPTPVLKQVTAWPFFASEGSGFAAWILGKIVKVALESLSGVTQTITYRRRRGRVSRGEREWRIGDDALVMTSPSGGEKRTPWKDVIGVRLYHEELRSRPWRYAFELHTRQGDRIVIDNAHCLGARQYEDRSASYTPFVRAALAHIAEANPKARLLIGETQKRYFFLMLVALLAVAALALAVMLIPTPLDATPFAAPVKLGAILLLLPVFWFGVLRSMPRGAPLDAIPERALPPEPGAKPLASADSER